MKMKFSDLLVGRKCITSPEGGGEGLMTRFILVKIPPTHTANVIRLCDGTLDRLPEETLIIEVE